MELLYPKESYKISGAIYEVHKELGPGLLEKVYQEALEKEFIIQNIPYEREKDFTIVINYLCITGYKLGLLVNFNARQVKPERIVRF